MKTLVLNREVLVIIEESIREGKSVSLTVRGNSMSPLLLDGRDTVKLISFRPEELKEGDVILFRYGPDFLMHRIVRIDRNNSDDPPIITKGDALSGTEKTTMSHVVALALLPEHGLFTLWIRKGLILLRSIRLRFRRILYRINRSED